jgi:hypothetical protein
MRNQFIWRISLDVLGLILTCFFIYWIGTWGVLLLLFNIITIQPTILLYHFRNGIKEENGIIHMPIMYGKATLIRIQIKGFSVERRFWDRLKDSARLTVYFKDGQKITFSLPDYMIEEVVKNKDLILQP